MREGKKYEEVKEEDDSQFCRQFHMSGSFMAYQAKRQSRSRHTTIQRGGEKGGDGVVMEGGDGREDGVVMGGVERNGEE